MSKYKAKGNYYSEELFTQFVKSEFYKNKKSFRDKMGK